MRWNREPILWIVWRELGIPSTSQATRPFPDSSAEQAERIAEAARELDRLRTGWLNPPEWTREEVLQFPGSANGPWAR